MSVQEHFTHLSNGCHIEINLSEFLIARELIEFFCNSFGNDGAVLLADFDQHDDVLPDIVSGVKITFSYG